MICMYTSKFEFPVHRFFRNNSFYYISIISCKERKSTIPRLCGDVLIKTVNKKSIRSDDQTPFCHVATIRRWEHTKTNFSTGFVTIYYTFDFLESEDSSLFYNPHNSIWSSYLQSNVCLHPITSLLTLLKTLSFNPKAV